MRTRVDAPGVRTSRAEDRLFYLVLGALTLLAAVPFWLTRLLPMQDYSNFLLFARAYGDCRDPASPFFGTYTTGFPLSPLLLPILITRAIGAFTDLETGGRVIWTLYAVGLPLSSLYLLRVLGRDRWAVLLVFPIVLSYWVIGGFFAYGTAGPLLVLGLAASVRWLSRPTWPRGAVLAALFAAAHLWHALVFAQLCFDFGALWLLARFEDPRARLRALAPLVPALGLFCAWTLAGLQGHVPRARAAVWPPFFDNAAHFFEFIGPVIPQASGAIVVLAVVLAVGAIPRLRLAPAAPEPSPFRVETPFAWLAALSVVLYMILPSKWLGVEGLGNRQPWVAALLLVFAWSLPARPWPRAALLALVGGVGAAVLVHMASRFAAFSRESGGASRLIDRLGPGETLLAPVGVGSTPSFPGKPLIALELYASIRNGGLPNGSFAGYKMHLVRYVGDRNPMPGISGPGWIDQPGLKRFDYVLLRGPTAAARPQVVQEVARDGEWTLFAVCGSKARPRCS